MASDEKSPRLGIGLDIGSTATKLVVLGADGRPLLREDGKVLKGPGYHRPDIARVLREHGWQG